MKRNQEELTNKRALTSVPTIIVNGKYRINTDKIGKGNFEGNYKKLVSYLLTIK
jgi:thiol:disulfide interchange protein DsbA